MTSLPAQNRFRAALRLGLDAAVAILLGWAAGRGASRIGDPARAAPLVTLPPGRSRLALGEIATSLYREVQTDRVVAVAAGVGFFAVLALFPALAAFVSLFGILVHTADVGDLMTSTGTLLPPLANDLVRSQIEKLAAASKASLSLASVAALGLSIWSANSATKAILDALNVAYGVSETRGFVRYNVISLLFTVGAVIVVIGLLLTFAAIPAVLDRLWLGWAAEALMDYGRWPLIFTMLITAIATLYRYGADVPGARWRWISPGSVVASCGILGFSFLFSWYASNWTDYNATYGSLGAAIVLMTWLWLSTAILLVGAELNAILDGHASGS